MTEISKLEGLASIWAEHGLAGLTILALFLILGYSFFLCRRDAREDRKEFRAERDQVRGEFTHALKEVTATNERTHDKVATVVQQLEAVIRDRK